MLGLPFHYRDARTDGHGRARARARAARASCYAVTGIQTMPINTVFQLLADDRGPRSPSGSRWCPTCSSYWLTGELVNEITNASTTGLLDARAGTWARGLIERLGLPAAPFAGDPVEAGTTLGPVLAHHGIEARRARRRQPRHGVGLRGGADPQPARGDPVLGDVVAARARARRPVLTDRAREYNLTNERGVDGTIRLLRNVMGLWIVQECRRCWGDPSYDELMEQAAAARADVPLFDPDDERFLAPGDMPARIADACAELGQPRPEGRGETVRSALVSLACKYRLVLERLERAAGVEVEVVHVIGGGARNELLCRLTADLLRRPVLAGPVEATALGNVLVQARAVGELGSLAEMRAIAAASAEPVVYEPGGDADGDLRALPGEGGRGVRLEIETPSWGYGDSGHAVRHVPAARAGRAMCSSGSTTRPRCIG